MGMSLSSERLSLRRCCKSIGRQGLLHLIFDWIDLVGMRTGEKGQRAWEEGHRGVTDYA